MAVDLMISRVSNGSIINDKLSNTDYGVNHGEITNNVTTLNEKLFITHTGVEKISNLKVYIDNLAELLEWADALGGDGVLIDLNNDEVFEVNVKTGIADSEANAVLIGDLEVATELILRLKVRIPSSEQVDGIRKFNLNFNFDYTI